MSPYITDFETILQSIVSSLLSLVGLGFFIYLIIAGYHFLNAGSNKEAAAQAQRAFTSAFLGLTISLCAWLLIDLLSRFLGITNIRNIDICIVPPC